MIIVHWTQEEEQKLIECYQNKLSKIETLMLFPRRSYQALKRKAQELNIKKTRLQVKNENFFDTPNTINCSVAGFIASDGCILPAKNKNGHRIIIRLCRKDKQILEDIKRATSSNASINDSERTCVLDTKRNINKTEKTYFISGLDFSSALNWSQKLAEHWNIVPQKSLILLPPNLNNIDDKLAYICGLISGDGTIGFLRHKNFRYFYISLLGTERLLNWIKITFEEFLQEKIKPTIRKERLDGNIWAFQINGMQAVRIFEKINTLNCVKLNRKWKSEEILECVNQSKIKNYISFLDYYLSSHSIPYTKQYDYFMTEKIVLRLIKLDDYDTKRLERRDFIKQFPDKQVIQIFENEILEYPKIVENRLNHYFGLVKRSIYARKCEVREVNSELKKKFLNKYHIQGDDYSSIYLGLFYKKRLVNIMTFANYKDGVYCLSRIAGNNHFNIVGGASKLLKAFERQHNPKSVFSFADKRWSKGNLYFKLNFINTKEVEPSYHYFKLKEKKLYHKFLFRRKFLSKKLENFNPGLSESENMKNNNWLKIWDAGLIKFVKQYN